MKHIDLTRPFLAASLLIASAVSLKAQMAGTNTFLQGNYVEVGVSQCGVYGSPDAPPVGYHPNAGFAPGIGFVADYQKDGWATSTGAGAFNYCGDYFVPGSPVEGWSLTFNGIDYINTNTGCTIFNIPGSNVSYSSGVAEDTAVWQGGVAGLNVTQTTLVPTDDVYFLTRMKFVNTTTDTVTGVYYGRNVDPDQEQPWTGDFTTMNRIVSQPVAGGTDDALVLSWGLSGQCYLGLGSQDPRASVNYGGFGTIPADDLYFGVGRTTAVGSTLSGDIGNGLGFSLGDILPGDSVEFAFVYVLDTADLDSAMLRTAPPCDAETKTLTVDACESYLFNGSTLTTSGTYVANLFTLCGADSTVNLNLTIHHSTATSLNEVACGSYLFNGSTLTTSGTYTANLLSTAGCDSIVTLNLMIDAAPDLTVTVTGPTLTAAAGFTYQWVDCDAGFAPIAGETSQSFTAMVDGHYACVISNGACMDTTACNEIMLATGTTDPQGQLFTLSPNPATDHFTLNLGNATQAEVTLLNVAGQMVWKRSVSGSTFSADLSGLEPGVYFVKVAADGREQTLQLLIQN